MQRTAAQGTNMQRTAAQRTGARSRDGPFRGRPARPGKARQAASFYAAGAALPRGGCRASTVAARSGSGTTPTTTATTTPPTATGTASDFWGKEGVTASTAPLSTGR